MWGHLIDLLRRITNPTLEPLHAFSLLSSYSLRPPRLCVSPFCKSLAKPNPKFDCARGRVIGWRLQLQVIRKKSRLMQLEPSLPTPEERLRAAGQRVTAQRVLLIRLLDEANEHLDAEELYRRARREMPNINLSTVYRNLTALKEAGLVEQRYFARDHSREYFESAVQDEHYHFTCLSCGKVVEFETPLIAKVRHDLQAQLGVDIRHACICFEGLCAECAAAEKRTQPRDGSPSKQMRIQLT